MATIKLYPRNNLDAGLLTYDSGTGCYTVFTYLDTETGEYRRTFTTRDPVEAWTAYMDAVDAHVRRRFKEAAT